MRTPSTRRWLHVFKLQLRRPDKLAPTPPKIAHWVTRTPYQELIGSLNYIAVTTRPDIAFAVCRLVRDSHIHSRHTRQSGIAKPGESNCHNNGTSRRPSSVIASPTSARSAPPYSRTSNSQNIHHPKSTSSRTNALLAPSCTPCSEPVRTSPTASEHSVCTRKARSHAWRRTPARPRSSVPLPLCDEGLGSWGLVYQRSAPEGLTLTGYIDAD